MAVSFTDPLWWLLLPGLVALAWYLRLPWLSGSGPSARVRRERRRLYIRLVLIVLLVAALSGPGLVSVIDSQAVVLALDVSDSVGFAINTGERWVRESLEARPPGTAAGVVTFGRRALVEEPPGEQPDFHNVGTDPGGEASRIGEALRFSRAILPRDARQRVVLLTDGRDTGNGAIAAARQLHADGVRVDVAPVGTEAGADVRLDRLYVAPRARVGQSTTVELTVNSDISAAAQLFLERDGELLSDRTVSLRAGENRLAMSIPAGGAGLHRYRVRVMAADRAADAFTANNEGGGIQEVTGPPGVLVLAPSAGEARSLTESLQAAGELEVTVAGPGEAPRGAAAWARYQAVFLVNVPAYLLGEKALRELETYVRDGGGGLVMVGGPNCFGPGGYAGTPVERALPVDMDIQGRGEQPSLGLILVIDKSGSMSGVAGGADKIGLAREAAARSVSVLTERDRAGVLAFDSLPWWAVPPGPVDNKDKLRRQISGIQANGGTEIYPPLMAAYQALRDMPTKVKHIILLTDGISAGGGDYQALLADMCSAGITLSTVAVGAEADAGMLQALSELGRGRFYQTGDADSIPAIFTKETVMATRSFAVNERFYPLAASSGVLLRGLGELPGLDGYITATPKKLADTLLVSHRGDPVLAAWQYGLGRTVAWTPDAGGRWSASWAAGDVFPRLWGNVLSWILPAGNNGSVHIRAEVLTGGGAAGQTLQIDVEDPGDWRQVRSLSTRVTAPDGSTVAVPLEPAGPGRYKARQPVEQPGAYMITVFGAGEEEGANRRVGESRGDGNGDGAGESGDQFMVLARSGVVVAYPAEYAETGVDMEALRAIARAGGGAVLEKPEQAFANNLPPVRARRDLSTGLLTLAVLLWLADVAGRRLVLGSEERAALRRFRERLRQNVLPGVLRGRDRGAGQPDSPVWPGGTLSRMQELRGRYRSVPPGTDAGSGVTRSVDAVGENDSGKDAQPGPARQAGRNGRTGQPKQPEQTGQSGQQTGASPEQTASRLLDAKRRRFK
ncbi:VWA domain-containing protein [Desulfoscipio sp. XC116]|uniref:VWA domain-containing protein n=1 Tax=Desulfoscipio sp. XC116 TaxID=3144975 RepID=UPI00325BDC97